MKRLPLLVGYLLSMFTPIESFAANVTKGVITVVEPVIGEVRSFKASSSNVFSTTSNINVTINGHKAKVTKTSEKYITVKYTWKTLGGENPDSPEYRLKARLNLSSTSCTQYIRTCSEIE